VNKQMAARNAKGRLHFQETGFHREVKARPFPSESSAKNVIVVLCKHSFFGSESFHHYSGHGPRACDITFLAKTILELIATFL